MADGEICFDSRLVLLTIRYDGGTKEGDGSAYNSTDRDRSRLYRMPSVCTGWPQITYDHFDSYAPSSTVPHASRTRPRLFRSREILSGIIEFRDTIVEPCKTTVPLGRVRALIYCPVHRWPTGEL